MTEKHFKKEHIKRTESQKEALWFFFHNEHYNIRDRNKFNDKILRRTYRRLAITCHPDKQDGDHAEWLRLSAYYGILTAMWEEQNQKDNKNDLSVSRKKDATPQKAICFSQYQKLIQQNPDLVDINHTILNNSNDLNNDYDDDDETTTNVETIDSVHSTNAQISTDTSFKEYSHAKSDLHSVTAPVSR